MTIGAIFDDKSLKQKAKTAALGNLLLEKELSPEELIAFAAKAKDTEKATCIESLEYATKKDPAIATEACLAFVTASLADAAPRVKWEAAKVVGNIAPRFPGALEPAIGGLLANAESEGTVARWAAAYALGEILKLKTALNESLLPAIEALAEREEDGGIRKKYLDALKKARRK